MEKVAEQAESLNALFPIQLNLHVILALLAILVFGMQFIRFRKKHHFIMAIAFPCTLLPYLAPDNTTLFYGVGIFELIAFLLSFILSVTVDKEKKPVKTTETEQEHENKQEQKQQEENA